MEVDSVIAPNRVQAFIPNRVDFQLSYVINGKGATELTASKGLKEEAVESIGEEEKQAE